MAYVASDVYGNGINNEILNGEAKIYIALTSGDRTSSPDDASFLKKILAVSELRSGSGSTNDSTEGVNGAPETVNNVGNFSDKILSLLSVSYNRTKSVEGDAANFGLCDVNNSGVSDPSKVATNFAIIKYTGEVKPLVAYQVDNGNSTDNIVFSGPSINSEDASNHKVLIVGSLTSNPTINKDSNFMFGGAKITFTEA